MLACVALGWSIQSRRAKLSTTPYFSLPSDRARLLGEQRDKLLVFAQESLRSSLSVAILSRPRGLQSFGPKFLPTLR